MITGRQKFLTCLGRKCELLCGSLSLWNTVAASKAGWSEALDVSAVLVVPLPEGSSHVFTP